MSSNEWETYNLAEIITLIGGGTPSTKEPSYWDGDIPWISVVDFAGERKFITKTEKSITNDGLINSSTRLLFPGQLIISARGTVGELGVVREHMAFNQSCYGITSKNKTINEFLYYLLKYHLSDFKRNTHGAVFDTITMSTFESISANIPPIIIQEKIAEILGDLDAKIELNRQMNATLEAMAQAIFKEWFVDFNYPGATGDLVMSELGMIPKGWNPGRLAEVCELIKGVSYSSEELSSSRNALVTLKSINRGGGFNSSGYKEYTGKFKISQCLDEGDLIIAQTDITQNAEVIGSPAIVENLFHYDRLIASLDIVKLIPTNQMPSSQALLFFLQRKEFKEYCLSHTNGSTVLHLRSSEVPNYPIVIPDAIVLHHFNTEVTPIRNNIITNNQQTQALIGIRDILLPKLMSGGINVWSG